MRNKSNFDFEHQGYVDRVPVVSKIFFALIGDFALLSGILTPQVTFERFSTNFQLAVFKVSFAQWHYHSLWSSTETWWLLIENFSQYPARRREIPTAMQCFEGSSESTYNNEIELNNLIYDASPCQLLLRTASLNFVFVFRTASISSVFVFRTASVHPVFVFRTALVYIVIGLRTASSFSPYEQLFAVVFLCY